MLLLSTFIQYLISFIILAICAVVGVFAGKKLRKRKIEKEQSNEA